MGKHKGTPLSDRMRKRPLPELEELVFEEYDRRA